MSDIVELRGLVKPLEWKMLPPPYATGPLRPTALTSLGVYKVIFIVLGEEKEETYFAYLGESGLGNAPSIDEAKAIADAHWQGMVLAALNPAAIIDRLAEARAEALEEAEKAVREVMNPDRSTFVLTGPSGVIMQAVTAIRALKSGGANG